MSNGSIFILPLKRTLINVLQDVWNIFESIYGGYEEKKFGSKVTLLVPLECYILEFSIKSMILDGLNFSILEKSMNLKFLQLFTMNVDPIVVVIQVSYSSLFH